MKSLLRLIPLALIVAACATTTTPPTTTSAPAPASAPVPEAAPPGALPPMVPADPNAVMQGKSAARFNVPVEYHKLDNGLKVVLSPDRSEERRVGKAGRAAGPAEWYTEQQRGSR